MIPKNLVDDNGALFRRGKTVDNPVHIPGMRRGGWAITRVDASRTLRSASAPHPRPTGYAQVSPRRLSMARDRRSQG
jgi:hypothetical protein